MRKYYCIFFHSFQLILFLFATPSFLWCSQSFYFETSSCVLLPNDQVNCQTLVSLESCYPDHPTVVRGGARFSMPMLDTEKKNKISWRVWEMKRSNIELSASLIVDFLNGMRGRTGRSLRRIATDCLDERAHDYVVCLFQFQCVGVQYRCKHSPGEQYYLTLQFLSPINIRL